MSTGSSTQVTRRGLLPRLRDARIRSKLALILLVPLAAVLTLAGLRMVDIGRRADTAGQVEKLARMGTDISALTQVLQVERMTAAAFLASAGASGSYEAAVKATDAQIRTYRDERSALDDVPSTVQGRLAAIDDHLDTIEITRGQVSKREDIAVPEAVSRYGVIIDDLVGYGEAVSQFAGDGEVGDSLRATGAFARAKAGASEQEAVSYAARVANDLSPEQRSVFIATQTAQQEALASFTSFAEAGQRQLVEDVVTGDAVNLADQVATSLSRGVPVPAIDITQAFGAVVDLMRFAEQQLESENIRLAAAAQDSVVRQAAIESAVVLLVLIVAIVLAVILARSLNMSLRRLREGALAVANRDLPEAVARLRDARNLGDGGADDILRQARDPIRMHNRDEIGQVAQAFNVVHREAVRIAAEQAALRTSVSTMFLNLARRSQSLVDRMIGELDSIERTEEDPKRLARLFELDHLATRMRRNDENLLVLAGADSSTPRREDALLVDALRAAQSEVELYNRVEFGTVDTDIAIVSLAVNDVVRLVAELLDNATRFSPPNTVVVADARRIRDYVVIQVEDRGLGMSEEQMDQLNRRLAEPPNVDVAAFRLMGLAVAGRLAARYDIRVELRANMEGGTVAQVTLPSDIVVLGSRRLDGVSRNGATPERAVPPSWEAMNAARAVTATLPNVAPDTWKPPTPEPAPPQGHPQLPMFPSQRPPSTPDPVIQPTPNRPPLPSRSARGTDGAATTPVIPAQRQASPESAPVTAEAAPAGPRASTPNSVAQAPEPAVTTRSATRPRTAANGASHADANGWGAALTAMPPVPAPPPLAPPAGERTEAPIFVQMQQSWFNKNDAPGEEWGMPTAGYAPPPHAGPGSESGPATPPERAAASVTPPPSRPAPAQPAAAGRTQAPAAYPPGTGHNGASSSTPDPRAADDRWRTAADDGWRRAMAAAEPLDAGTTRSGLPKRVPQAQLVPGGVQAGPRNQNRRTPDEVRGLLSAYHRGVQRGRTDGSAENASQAKENN